MPAMSPPPLFFPPSGSHLDPSHFQLSPSRLPPSTALRPSFGFLAGGVCHNPASHHCFSATTNPMSFDDVF